MLDAFATQPENEIASDRSLQTFVSQPATLPLILLIADFLRRLST